MRLEKHVAIFAASAFTAATIVVAAMSFADTAPIGTVSITGSGSGTVPIATTTVAGKVKVGAGLGVTTDGTLSVTTAVFPNRTTLAAIGAGPTYKGQPIAPLATALRAGLIKVGTGLSVLPDGTLNNTGVAGVASFNARGGAVIPQANDYSIGQISGASAVASTGAYSDLSGKPVLAPVATSGSYTDLTGRPSLAPVATSGSYIDLSNKPAIPAAQVNADWGASSGVAQILNKPTIPTALSQLTQSASFRTVTDTEKATWNGNTAPVTSVFGRTGAIVKQAGDYTAADVGADALGAATSVQSNLDAFKIVFKNYTGNDRPLRSEVLAVVAQPDGVYPPWAGFGGWDGDPLYMKIYGGSSASPLTANAPLVRWSAVVGGNYTPLSGTSFQSQTQIMPGTKGHYTNTAVDVVDKYPGAGGDHVAFKAAMEADHDRYPVVDGGTGSGGDMWGFHAFVANNGYTVNGIGAELNVYNEDPGFSYLDDAPNGNGPNSTGHFMTGLQLLPEWSSNHATRAVSIIGNPKTGWDTGIANTGYVSTGIYLNSPNTIAFKDAWDPDEIAAYNGSTTYSFGEAVTYLGNGYVYISDTASSALPTNTTYWRRYNTVPAVKTDIKWGGATSNIGLDFSEHFFDTAAIKLAPSHTFSDGTVTKTLAQLATPPTNITGTAAGLSGTPALPNGTTATTQTAGDNSTKVATTAYVNAAVSASGGGNVTGPGSSTTGHVAVFAGTDGKTIADGGLPGTGTITGVTAGTGLTGGGTSGDVTMGMANMAATTLKGNNSGSSAAPSDLTRQQVLQMLGYDSNPSWGLELAATDTGDRSVYLDLHTSNGVDFNGRIVKSGGLNSQMTFNNRGSSGAETGPTVFDAESSIMTGKLMADGYVGAGTRNPTAPLHIVKEWSGSASTNYNFKSQSFKEISKVILSRSNGTVASPNGALSSGDVIGNFQFRGNDGTSDTPSRAQVAAIAAEAFTTTTQGTELAFYTSPLGTLAAGAQAERMRLKASGCLSVGANVDCGTGNLSVLNMIVSGYEEKTAAYTVSKDSSKITLASSTAVVTLPKTLPVGEVSVLVTVAGAAASGVSLAAESGGALSWGDIGAPTFTNSKTTDVVCLSQNAAATTTAAWRCTKGGDF